MCAHIAIHYGFSSLVIVVYSNCSVCCSHNSPHKNRYLELKYNLQDLAEKVFGCCSNMEIIIKTLCTLKCISSWLVMSQMSERDGSWFNELVIYYPGSFQFNMQNGNGNSLCCFQNFKPGSNFWISNNILVLNLSC